MASLCHRAGLGGILGRNSFLGGCGGLALHREAVDALSLEVFKAILNGALSNLV